MTRPTIIITAQALHRLMDELLGACGCPEDTRAIAAEVFLEAELRGIGLQGIDYMPYLIANLRNGNIDPQGRARLVKESEGSAVIDGGNGLGQPGAQSKMIICSLLAAAFEPAQRGERERIRFGGI